MNIIKVLFFILFSVSFLQAQDETNQPSAEELSNSQASNGFLDAFYTGADAPITTPAPQAGENLFFTLFRIVFITGLLGFLTWLVLKFFFRKNTLLLSHESSPIEVISLVPAGLGVYFVVAKLNNIYYLLSLSSDGMTLIDKITDKETADFLEIHKAQPKEGAFTDLLQNLPEGKSRKALEFLRSQIDRLRNK
ncbi:MAG: flagellar biosynthetic protein FliO [Brevinema sp.]